MGKGVAGGGLDGWGGGKAVAGGGVGTADDYEVEDVPAVAEEGPEPAPPHTHTHSHTAAAAAPYPYSPPLPEDGPEPAPRVNGRSMFRRLSRNEAKE